MAGRYVTDDNIEATDRAAKDVAKVGRAVATGVSDAAKNVSSQYDSNVREENKDIEKPKAVGTDYAERIATEHKDYGTRASAQGAKGTMPSYKKGTAYVPKTGPAILHEGERVLTAEDNKKQFAGLSDILGGAAKQTPKKELKHIVHARSANGGHILTHHYTHPETHKEEPHTFDNHDDMLNHVMEHMTDANEGEDDSYKEPGMMEAGK